MKKLKSLVDKTFSKIFDKAGKIEIGRKFSKTVLEPFFDYSHLFLTFAKLNSDWDLLFKLTGCAILMMNPNFFCILVFHS